MTSFTDYIRDETHMRILNETFWEGHVREALAKKGYRLMHRRKGQFSLIVKKPMTLDEIRHAYSDLPVFPA